MDDLHGETRAGPKFLDGFALYRDVCLAWYLQAANQRRRTPGGVCLAKNSRGFYRRKRIPQASRPGQLPHILRNFGPSNSTVSK